MVGPTGTVSANNSQLAISDGRSVQTAWQKLIANQGDRQVVFVGLNNSYFRPVQFFSDNKKALVQDMGFPANRVAEVDTGFTTPFATNADSLYKELLQLYQAKGKVPIVAIGNPTTSVDLLLTVLKHPDLLEKGIIDKMVLVQPAFGTPLANLPWPLNHLPVVQKNSVPAVRAQIDEALAKFPQALRSKLDDTVNYVRAGTTPGHINPLFFIPALLLKAKGPNDGISLENDQRIPGVGRDLEVWDNTDHWDLLGAGPAADSPAALRRKFTQSLFQRLYP